MKVDDMEQKNGREWGVRTALASFARKNNGEWLTIDAGISSAGWPKYFTSFYAENGTWLRSLEGSSGSWIRGATPMGGTSFYQPLPARMFLTYHSRFENKFYQLDEKLPLATIRALIDQKPHRTFRLWTQDEKIRTSSYDDLLLSFAPDGWVTLRMASTSARKELVSWQAKEVFPTIEEAKRANVDYWFFEVESYHNPEERKEYLETIRKDYPEFYRKYMTGGIHKVSAEWYKKMQTKYPWRLEIVTAEGDKWYGEYAIEFANVEGWPVIGKEAVEEDKKLKMRAMPTSIIFWVTEQSSGNRWGVRMNMFPVAEPMEDDYDPIYDDPQLNALYRKFQSLYPNRTRADNDKPVTPTDESVLRLVFDSDLNLTDAYLKKGETQVKIDAYIYNRYQMKRPDDYY